MRTQSHGREPMENLKLRIPMRRLVAGERGSPNPTWIMIKCPVLWGTTTTRISWPRFMVRDTHTSLTLLVLRRQCNPLQQTQLPTSTNRISWCHINTSRSWTWCLRMLRACPLPLPASSLPRVPIGPQQQLDLIFTRHYPVIRWILCQHTMPQQDTCTHI